MAAPQPLCPRLYELLRARFGTVRISSPGRSTRDFLVRRTDGTARTTIKEGEYYQICCPFCNDRRYRLWISYRFAEFPWLAHCYNEDCLAPPERKRWLQFQLNLGGRTKLATRAGEEPAEATELREADWPGECVALDQLDEQHKARLYLRGRRFSPDQAAQEWGARYCVRCPPEGTRALNRIIIPVFWDGRMVGWQGRLPYDKVAKHELKYYTMPGMPRGQLLYNFERARHQPCVVVCEGPLDVWRVGPAGVALFGKAATPTQRMLLLTMVPRTTPLLVLLDGNARKESDELYGMLREARPHTVGQVLLREGQDPGGLAEDVLLEEMAVVLARLDCAKDASCQ